jgi:hypothetical protein
MNNGPRNGGLIILLTLLVLAASVGGILTSETQSHQSSSQGAPHIVQIVPEPLGVAFLHDPVAIVTLILAVITGGLAVYTALLWRSTSALVGDAKDTSQHELRPYVYFDGPKTRPWPESDPNRVSAFAYVTNSGRTWAGNLIVQSAVVRLKPEETVDPFEFVDWSTVDSPPIVLGPSHKIDLQLGDVAFREFEAIKRGDPLVFFVARLRYDDSITIPNTIRETQISHRFTVDTENGWSFLAQRTHNTAT